jgi:hypothetical protein
MIINPFEFRMIAAGWLLLLVFLTLFWYLTLKRLSLLLKENLSATQAGKIRPGIMGIFRFIIRGDYEATRDERLIPVCRKLRQLLYGYLGVVGAYVVFLVVMHPRY